MRNGRRRGIAILSLVLLVACVLSVLGMMGAARESAARIVVAEAQARELLEQAGRSAVEEAAALVETTVPPVPAPVPGQEREASQEPALPAQAALGVTAAEFGPLGVSVEPARLRWSPWIRQEAPGPDGTTLVREIAVFEAKVTLTAKAAGRRVGRVLTVRRYASLETSPASTDGSPGNPVDRVAVKVAGTDLLLSMEDR